MSATPAATGPRVRILVVGGSRDVSKPCHHDSASSNFDNKAIARQFGLIEANQDTVLAADESRPVDFISRPCCVKSQGEPTHATLDISRPLPVEDFFHNAGATRARLQDIDVIFLVIHLNVRASFETLAQLAVLEENTVLDEASLHNPLLVRVFLAVHHRGEGGLTQTNEVSEDQVQWLADMLTGGRQVTMTAGDTKKTTQLVDDIAGEVIATRTRTQDIRTTSAASLGSREVSEDQPPSSQAARDAQIGHKGLKNGEWVRKIFGRT